MAEGDIEPEGKDNQQAHVSLERLSPDERAAFNAALEALAQIDLSQEFKAAGLLIETAPDGSQTIKFPEELEALADDAFFTGEHLPPHATGDALPTTDSGDNDMGLFDKFRICLCSEVTGVITKDGRPVAGAEVIRRLDLFLPKDVVYSDRTATDGNGRFEFKPRYASRLNRLLGETRVDQKILVRYEGKLHLGWAHVSHGMGLHRDILAPGTLEGFHVPLAFNGDLARATPLPDDAALDRLMKGDGFFNSQLVCVASRLHFFVTLKGEPASGAKVVRTAEHVGYDSYEQCKVTDRDGEVDLPELTAPQLVHPWSKTEIRQKVVITYDGRDYLGWEKTKTNPWEQGEYNLDNDRPKLKAEIVAELTDDTEVVRGIKTDPERCWQGNLQSDYLPDDAILYKGLFRVLRFDPGYQKKDVQ